MAKSPRHPIRTLCHKQIATWARPFPLSEEQVVRIVEQNLERGRFQRLANNRSQPRPFALADYINRILFHICREVTRVRALERGDGTAWQELRDFLARRAFRVVQRFARGEEPCLPAFDFADETCRVIFEEPYPFDVAFEAWATVILKNLIVAHYTRSADAMDRQVMADSLDAPRVSDEGDGTTLGELLADTQSLAPFEKIETQMVLLDAIDQLHSPAQRWVVRYSYLEDLDDAQIARRLGKTKQAVYHLRQRALARLKEILTEISLE